MSKKDERSERLKSAILDYEAFLAADMPDEARVARIRIQRLSKAISGESWDSFLLAKHGMKSALDEIRSGRIKNCSIGPDGSPRCHALRLVP